MSWEVRYSEIEDIRHWLKNHIDRIKGNLFANTGLKENEELDEFGFKVNINNKNLMNELEKLKDLILHAKNQLSNQNDQFPKEIEKPLSSSGRNELKSGDGKRLGNLELIEKGE